MNDGPSKRSATKSASTSKPARTYADKDASQRVGPHPHGDEWHLRLYVAGQTPKSLAAMVNVKRMLDEHLPGRYNIEFVDLLAHPRLAKEDRIVAVPTLVRKLPDPVCKIVGDLSDIERTLVGLRLRR